MFSNSFSVLFSIFFRNCLTGVARIKQYQVSLEKLTLLLLFGEKYGNELLSPRINSQYSFLV